MNYTTPDTDDPELRARVTIARSLAQYIDDLAAPAVSLRNITAHAAALEPLGDAERELRRLMELRAGARFTGETLVPWALLSRTLTTAAGASGGYAAGASLMPMHDALRGDSAILAAGAKAYDGLVDAVLVPRLAGTPTMNWVAEAAAGTEAAPTLGSVSATPRTLVGIIPVSVQLLRMSSAESVLRDMLRRGAAQALDAAAVAGTGGAQPLGIINTPDVGTASGTGLSYAGIWAQVEALLTAGAMAGELFALAGPTAGRILATRERAAGSGYILDGGRIGNVPCTVTPSVPASTLVLGVASQLAVCSWGRGLEIRASQSTGFNTASVDVRVKADLDIAVLDPSAFVVFPTVT